MPTKDTLTPRIRSALARKRGVTEQKMFGGIAFMVNANMCCAAWDDKLVLRLGRDGSADARHEAHTAPMDLTGKVFTTMICVLPKGCANDEDLQAWVDRAVRFVRTLPKKG